MTSDFETVGPTDGWSAISKYCTPVYTLHKCTRSILCKNSRTILHKNSRLNVSLNRTVLKNVVQMLYAQTMAHSHGTCVVAGLFVWRVRSHAHAPAHAQTYLRVLFVACMKSHIQLKRSCSIGYSSFNPSFLFTSSSLNNAVYVNSVSQALVMTARTLPKTEGQFYRAFLCRFSVSFFF